MREISRADGRYFHRPERVLRNDEDGMQDRLQREDFLPLVGRSVEVVNANRRAQVEILEASSIASPSPRAEPFRVIFRSAADWHAPQGIYEFHHPDLGVLEVFAVPVGPDGEGLCYEVIFN